MKDAYTDLSKKAPLFAARLLCSDLSKQDAWIAYFAVFIPSTAYYLPVSHHSKKKLRKLQSIPTRAVLMKIGFIRNTAHRVVFGPSRYGGLGFRDLFVEQGISHVELLLRHLRADSPQGQLFRIAISWWQLVVGVSYTLLQNTSTVIPHLEANWLSALRHFLSETNASIHIDKITSSLPQPLREGDQCLMDVILDLPDVSRSQLRAFERCRLFIGVMYLSEISTADGLLLARDSWEGHRPRISPLLWPFQPKPGPNSFRVWRRLLATAFLRGHKARVSATTLDLTLRRRTSRWFPSSDTFRYQWQSFYLAPLDTLFILSDDAVTFTLHPAKSIRRRPKNPVRAFTLDFTNTTRTLPAAAVPVDVEQETTQYVIPSATLP
jgi:hypothetical protein